MYHSTKIAKARPGFDDRPEHPSVQINSSSPCFNLNMHVSLPEMLAGLDLFILEDLERLLLPILIRRSEHSPALKLLRFEELRLLLV